MVKGFRGKIGRYEGKLFAESHKDASIFGRNFYPYDQEPFFVVEVNIDDEFSKIFDYEYPDQSLGVGTTFAVDRDKLNDFNNYMKFNVLHYITYE